MNKKKTSKSNRIGVITQDRGVMPSPTVKDEVKKKKNDRKAVKQKIKQGIYE